MEVRELKTLLTLMRDYGLVELEIEDKKGKVRLVRGGGRASVDVTEAGSEAHLAAHLIGARLPQAGLSAPRSARRYCQPCSRSSCS